MTSSQSLGAEYIDGEVLSVLRKMPGLTSAGIYFQLSRIPQVLVYASIKRLQKTEQIGFCLVDQKTFPQGESESIDNIPPGGINLEDHEHSPRGNLRVKANRPKGTARTDHEYYSIYLGSEEIVYLGGGNTQTPLAQKRKAEFEHLMQMGIIHADLPKSEIIRLVQGIQCRNRRFNHE